MPSMRCVGRIGRGDGKQRPATLQSSKQHSSRSSSSLGRGVAHAFSSDESFILQARHSGRVHCKLPPAGDMAYAADVCGAQLMHPLVPHRTASSRCQPLQPSVLTHRAGCARRLLEGTLAGPLAAFQRRPTPHNDLRSCFPLQLCRNRCCLRPGSLMTANPNVC